ncbi:TolC family protein [Pedobacter nototheniae]|uniref:TolC family protein n=1 Tax=Pedobacter nototheniae TaxID=2488994 RepID=UPI0029300B75|nr:TolC family protein [Pedobacter nototheniae]
MNIKLTRLLFVLIMICSSKVIAQQLIDPQLREPIKQAISTNYELLNKNIEVHKTIINAESVHAKRLPEISANAAYTYFNQSGVLDVPTVTLPITGLELFEGSRSFSTNGNIGRVGLLGKQIIFSGMQIPNAEKALMEKSKAEQLMADASKEGIAMDVIGTFDQLMLLAEVDKLIVDTEKRLQKENLYVSTAIKNGLAIPYDRDKIRLALLELEAKKTEVKGNRQLLLQKLTQLTHLDVAQFKNINYPLNALNLTETNFNAENRKELQALQHSSKAYEYLIKKEKGSALPAVFAFANVSYLNVFNSTTTLKDVGTLGNVDLKLNKLSTFPNVLVGIAAKWDIYAGGEHKHKKALAKADLEINENKIKDTEEKLNLLINKSKIDYENTLEKIKITEQQIVISKNNMLMGSKQYQEGLINISERLEIENDLYKSSLNYYMQVIQQRSAGLQLLQNSGNLLKKIMN